MTQPGCAASTVRQLARLGEACARAVRPRRRPPTHARVAAPRLTQDYEKFGIVDMNDKQALFRLIQTLSTQESPQLTPDVSADRCARTAQRQRAACWASGTAGQLQRVRCDTALNITLATRRNIHNAPWATPRRLPPQAGEGGAGVASGPGRR